MFQIILRLILGCAGISIIWNAVVGFELVDCFFAEARRWQHFGVLAIALLPSAVGDVYYFYTLPLLTNIAHSCAVLMGILTRLAMQRCTPASPYDTV